MIYRWAKHPESKEVFFSPHKPHHHTHQDFIDDLKHEGKIDLNYSTHHIHRGTISTNHPSKELRVNSHPTIAIKSGRLIKSQQGTPTKAFDLFHQHTKGKYKNYTVTDNSEYPEPMKEQSYISSIIQTLQERGYKTPDKMKKKIKVHVDPEEMTATTVNLNEPKDSISESEDYSFCKDCGKSLPKNNLTKHKGDLLCPKCVQHWEGPIKPINIKESKGNIVSNNPFVMVPYHIGKAIGSAVKLMLTTKTKKLKKKVINTNSTNNKPKIKKEPIHVGFGGKTTITQIGRQRKLPPVSVAPFGQLNVHHISRTRKKSNEEI